jgi:dolichol-phosphate mannosyltransferase
MKIEKVVIIIPTYNEALVIEETITKLFQYSSQIKHKDIHILVFDSASADQTQDIVKSLQACNTRLHLKTEAKKSGLGSAYWQAMNYALSELSADIVVEFDADLSHQPHYLGPILNQLEAYDVVVGSRYVSGGCIPRAWGWHRKLLSILGNYVARLFLTTKYKDFTSGFRATRSALLKKALPEKFLSNHYAYKLELFWRLYKNHARIIEYPIEFIDREKGQSKLPANSIMDSLGVLFALRFNELKKYLKMCMVGLSGVAVQCVIYNALRSHLNPLSAIKFATIAAIINNFTLNNHFTFKENRRTQRYQKFKVFVLFMGYSAFMIGLQNYWLSLGLHCLGAGLLQENMTMVSGIVLGSFLNYLFYSRLVWKKL